MDLTLKKCIPCETGTPPLNREKIEKYQLELKNPWEVIENTKIKRKFKFEDFEEAMEFVNKVADIAEVEQHHPDIHISYSKVTLELWTHAIGGLSENDFIIAAKIEDLK